MREILTRLSGEDLARWQLVSAERTVAQSPPTDMTSHRAADAWLKYWEVAAELLEAYDIDEAFHEVFIDPVAGHVILKD